MSFFIFTEINARSGYILSRLRACESIEFALQYLHQSGDESVRETHYRVHKKTVACPRKNGAYKSSLVTLQIQNKLISKIIKYILVNRPGSYP